MSDDVHSLFVMLLYVRTEIHSSFKFSKKGWSNAHLAAAQATSK